MLKIFGADQAPESPSTLVNDQPWAETPFSRGKYGHPPRIPPEVDGIQVNHCRSVKCEDFGVSPRLGI